MKSSNDDPYYKFAVVCLIVVVAICVAAFIAMGLLMTPPQ
jgi:hypothetical protein